MRKTLLTSTALALLIFTGFPAGAKSVVLKHSFTPGQIDKYRMSIDLNLSAPELTRLQPNAPKNVRMKISLLFTQKVLGILPDGSARVRMSCSDLKIESPGDRKLETMKIPPVSMTAVISGSGQLLSIEDLGTSAGMQGTDMNTLASQLGSLGVFPDRPIEVGEIWSSTVPLPFGSGNLRVDSELMAAAVPLGTETASKIKQTYEAYMSFGDLIRGIAPSGAAPAGLEQMDGGLQLRGWSVLFFSPQKGRLLKSNSNITAMMSLQMPDEAVQQGAPPHMSFQMEITVNMARV